MKVPNCHQQSLANNVRLTKLGKSVALLVSPAVKACTVRWAKEEKNKQKFIQFRSHVALLVKLPAALVLTVLCAPMMAVASNGMSAPVSYISTSPAKTPLFSDLKERIASSSNASSREVTRGPSLVQNTVSIDGITTIGGHSGETTPGTCGANET